MADLNDLAAKAQTSSDWKRAPSRSREPNPFEDLLRQSFEDGTPRQIEASSQEQADEIKRALRRAARYTKVGLSIKEEPTRFGHILVKFKGKNARRYENGNAAPESTVSQHENEDDEEGYEGDDVQPGQAEENEPQYQ